jgi:hypothetical protein
MNNKLIKRIGGDSGIIKNGYDGYSFYKINKIKINETEIEEIGILNNHDHLGIFNSEDEERAWNLLSLSNYRFNNGVLLIGRGSELEIIKPTKVEFKIEEESSFEDRWIDLEVEASVETNKGIIPVENIGLSLQLLPQNKFDDFLDAINRKSNSTKFTIEEIKKVVNSRSAFTFEIVNDQALALHLYDQKINWNVDSLNPKNSEEEENAPPPPKNWKKIEFTTASGSTKTQITNGEINSFVYSLVIKNPFEWEYQENGESKKQSIDIINFLLAEVKEDEWKKLLEDNKEITVEIENSSSILILDQTTNKWILEVSDFRNFGINRETIISNSPITPNHNNQNK